MVQCTYREPISDQRCSKHHLTRTYLIELCFRVCCRLALGFPPEHDGIDQRLGLFASYMTKRRDQLIKVRIYPWPAYIFNSRLALSDILDTTVDLGVGLSNKLDMAQSQVQGGR